MNKLAALTMVGLSACTWQAPPEPVYYQPAQQVCTMPFDYSPYRCSDTCCYWDACAIEDSFGRCIRYTEEVWCSYDECHWTFRHENSYYEPYCETTTYDYPELSYYCEDTWCLYSEMLEWELSDSVCCDYSSPWSYSSYCWYE